MKNYMQFDVDGFFRDYKKNKRKLKDLEWDLAQACSQGGMDYAKPKVTGGLPSSQVETAVERIADIKAKIDDLNEYFARADKFLKLLNNTEKEIAKVYFIQGRKGSIAIDELSVKLGYSKTPIYKMINGIRKKIRNYTEKE